MPLSNTYGDLWITNTISPTWVGLLTSLTSNGDSFTECSGTGYARQSMTTSAPSNKTAFNSNLVDFGTTPDTTWGIITFMALFPSAISPTIIQFYELPVPIDLASASGILVDFLAGDITVTIV